ncbi:peptidoglycan DD-metalloendopeptidase family protein [Vibrio coralliilyticus]|uniref:peptidoglycan DD-metalloendopeptidase family protein n=1 Tax=Vibrio coralliilyticus TaxID=190893 RepID=UPI0006CD401B|nr:peptidoglycan DD-metalloendopeptidase family protein [Vibrio coralliilyticus]AXN34205.1 peptidase M23 [Vibrio coralliilyticus]KPH24261.1 peptidase M23 [Vibrio coralliilyticus]NRF13148.1 peptidoglycan DD-metalloendopeptidase family protein [Vibrio coralliilyticus]NRF61172.1 peptidoglycan DD-metalloendopeptidase family protein [Vibrio coralliilyticus]
MMLLSLPVVAALVLSATNKSNQYQRTIDLSLPESSIVNDLLTDVEVIHDMPNYEYVIQKGDNLSSIFSQLGFGYSELMKIMETDLNYLALDTLKPGNILRFWRDAETKNLAKMELEFSIVERAVYNRHDDGSYTFEDVKIPGTWKEQALVGEIAGSFSQSLHRLGLGSSENEQIVSLLKDKLNFARDLRAGDVFEVVLSKQYVGEQLTGNKELQAVKIYNRGKEVTAYLHSDGQYYDKNGNSLQRAFQRKPLNANYRLSSNFNPTRKHPVTGRIAPHNGTDWAAPTGTPIVSTGDGVVVMTRKHPYAGNYVVIQHGSRYKTRYLHLSKILVRKGQKVSRGERIGLSGATGRVTGPHIHYELIDRGRPVNAMTANIPMASSVPKSEMTAFKVRRDELDAMLRQQEIQLAKQSEPETTG